MNNSFKSAAKQQKYYIIKFKLPFFLYNTLIDYSDEVIFGEYLSISIYEKADLPPKFIDDSAELNWVCEILYEDKPELDIWKNHITKIMANYDNSHHHHQYNLNVIRNNIISSLHIQYTDYSNWQHSLSEQFPMIHFDRYVIYGNHLQKDSSVSKLLTEQKNIGIMIDAGMAFGTGEHYTTSGCLEALSYIKDRDQITINSGFYQKNMLDIGCGTGILAMAMAKLWKNNIVIASDIDEIAVKIARDNIINNKLAKKIITIAGDGLKNPRITNHGKYNIICANILANPLINMARAISHYLAEGGYLIISGFLDYQHISLRQAYANSGLTLCKKISKNSWITLVFIKKLDKIYYL